MAGFAKTFLQNFKFSENGFSAAYSRAEMFRKGINIYFKKFVVVYFLCFFAGNKQLKEKISLFFSTRHLPWTDCPVETGRRTIAT